MVSFGQTSSMAWSSKVREDAVSFSVVLVIGSGLSKQCTAVAVLSGCKFENKSRRISEDTDCDVTDR